MEEQELEQRLIDVDRVTRVTAGGRRFSFRALVVVGDKQGRVGVALGKANDVALAIEKATSRAKKNLITLPLKQGTIPLEISAKYKSAKVFLKPSKKGHGIIAGGVIRTICELGGIKDITAKIISRSGNKINNARAALRAFRKISQILKTQHATPSVKTKEKEKA